MTCHHLQWTWLTWRQGCALHIFIFFLLKAVASKVVWLALVFLFLFTSSHYWLNRVIPYSCIRSSRNSRRYLGILLLHVLEVSPHRHRRLALGETGALSVWEQRGN